MTSKEEYIEKVRIKIEKLNRKISKRIETEIADYEAMCKSLFPEHNFKFHIDRHSFTHVTIDPPLQGNSRVNWFTEKDTSQDLQLFTIVNAYDNLMEFIEIVTEDIRINYPLTT